MLLLLLLLLCSLDLRLLLDHRTLLLLLLLLLVSDGKLAGRDRDLGLEQVLDAARRGGSDPGSQLRPEALGCDDGGG